MPVGICRKLISSIYIICIVVGSCGLIALEVTASRSSLQPTGMRHYVIKPTAVTVTSPSLPSPLPTVIAPDPFIPNETASTQVSDSIGEESDWADELALPVTLQDYDSQRGQAFSVVKIIDGDTFVANYNGLHETVRLIGIDTPELSPYGKEDCFSFEAKAALNDLLGAGPVFFEPDPTQQDRDKYNRLLRYVYLGDGRFVNELLLQEGFAYEYTYRVPYLRQTEFLETEQKARLLQKGLWAACK